MSDGDLKEAAAEPAFVHQVKALLDAGNARLDARTRSRLAQARHAALERTVARRRPWLQWAPALGVAAAAVLAVMLWPGGRQAPVPPAAMMSSADLGDPEILEIVLGEDSLDLYEDLEFYEWVGAEPESI